MVPRPRHGRLLAGQCRRRRHLRLCRRKRASKKIATFHTLRQQLEKREGRYNVALSDFIAPKDTFVPDYIGAFVVTAGIGEDVIADRFKNANDDYSSILCKALADRLAEAFAERMHQRVRKEFWGYAPDETLAADQLILEQYPGIRPAPGYPAQPDHTEKATLFRLLDAENTAGVKLTESFAMWPGSSVSGLYFSHPESLFRRRQDRARPGRGLCRAQGQERRRDRALAGAGAELHPRAGTGRGEGTDGGDRTGQRCRLASAGLHLRGASGVAEEGGGGVELLSSLLPLWEKVARTKSVPDEGFASAETDPSPVCDATHRIHPLPQGERGRNAEAP